MEKVVKRGYVKWTDSDGVFHKEPLADHPELLAQASPKEQLQAEEARRLNASAEEFVQAREEENVDETQEVLDELKAAPAEVLTAAQLTEEAPASAPEDDGQQTKEVKTLSQPAEGLKLTPPDDHDEALDELREKTSS